jgi:molybdate transport system permease protein
VSTPTRLSARERERLAAGGPTTGRPPLALLVPAGVALAFLLLPLAALVARAPWGRLGEILTQESVRQALWLSLWTASVATVIATVIGVPLAWVMARTSMRAVPFVRALVTVPLVLPPVVGGVALLLAFGRNGIVGSALHDWFGLTIPFSPLAVILAETFVAMPFLIISVEGALATSDRGYDEAAAALGASRLTTFRRVTLPMLAPAIAAGAMLCWARALGEFGATITFAGSFPGRTQTMPIAVYYALEQDPDVAIALSLVLLLVSVSVLVGLRRRWWRWSSPG